jgi:hypothetical protein
MYWIVRCTYVACRSASPILDLKVSGFKAISFHERRERTQLKLLRELWKIDPDKMKKWYTKKMYTKLEAAVVTRLWCLAKRNTFWRESLNMKVDKGRGWNMDQLLLHQKIPIESEFNFRGPRTGNNPTKITIVKKRKLLVPFQGLNSYFFKGLWTQRVPFFSSMLFKTSTETKLLSNEIFKIFFFGVQNN